jgi:MauM/NapG family ferredoxin protein
VSWLNRLSTALRRAGAAAKAPPTAPEPQVDRRQLVTGAFLKGLWHAAAPTVERVEAATAAAARSEAPRQRPVPLIRPPGAVREEDFLAGCTRCMDCATACPHQAIVAAPIRLRDAAGTPTIQAIDAPCRMCPDMPCITACAPGVLRRDVPVKMATARIMEHTCLAHQGSTCSSCHERCPVPGAFTVVNGRPTVVEDVCTGCGVCAHVCPAPQNAVLLLPILGRPARPQSASS